ncbi:hypothetical protein Taro_009370, partial [Colocasia esculenta]|nr:hypothetical protein [Colocasia esculenta]
PSGSDTGYIGRFIVEVSAKVGNPTFLFIRKSTTESTDPNKAKLLQGFKDTGVTFLYCDLYDHESLVSAIKQVDVVISTVGTGQVPEQTKITAAIKEAGNVKVTHQNPLLLIGETGYQKSRLTEFLRFSQRFFPSEFGNDVDRVHARLLEAEGIPHTIVSSNFFTGYFLPSLAQPGFLSSPPRNKVIILDDGNPKAIFVNEEDIGMYTILAPNTCWARMGPNGLIFGLDLGWAILALGWVGLNLGKPKPAHLHSYPCGIQ